MTVIKATHLAIPLRSPTTRKENLTKVDPPGANGTQSFSYDAVSRIKTMTDGKGQVSTYTYDALDRIVDLNDLVQRIHPVDDRLEGSGLDPFLELPHHPLVELRKRNLTFLPPNSGVMSTKIGFWDATGFGKLKESEILPEFECVPLGAFRPISQLYAQVSW